MAPITPGRIKLYPLQDPRIAYYPTLPVAGALPSQSTAVISVICPQRDRYVVSNGAAGGGASAAAMLDPSIADEPPCQLRVQRPVLSRSPFMAHVTDQSGICVLTIRALSYSRRSPAVYQIYDESTLSSTKGMPKRVPVYSVVDRAHLVGYGSSSSSSGVFVDAVVSKIDKPILSIRVEQPLSQDVSWVVQDVKSDRPAVTAYDFVPDPSLPPTVTLKIEPPYCNQISFVLALWAITFDLYSKRASAKHRRR